MKTAVFWVMTASLLWFAAPAFAHEVANMEHSHAFQQTGYGKSRQGHYVNGPQGSIIIWSPRTQTGYQQGSAVEFARPEPITKAPSSPNMKPGKKTTFGKDYGKTTKRDYGD